MGRLRRLENSRSLLLNHMGNFDFKFLQLLMMNFFRFLEPAGLVSHKHFPMLHNTFMSTQISATLHPYSGSISPIIKASFKTLTRRSPGRGVYTEPYCYLLHSQNKILRDN